MGINNNCNIKHELTLQNDMFIHNTLTMMYGGDDVNGAQR